MADIREKHQLTEYIGHDHSMQYFRPTEGKWMEFRDGDRLLLCTDGFFDYCSNGQMKELLLQNRPFGETVDQFMELAFKNNSDDNITCAMIGKTKI
jgi:serine/threonine protein phosphatase PrpC